MTLPILRVESFLESSAKRHARITLTYPLTEAVAGYIAGGSTLMFTLYS